MSPLSRKLSLTAACILLISSFSYGITILSVAGSNGSQVQGGTLTTGTLTNLYADLATVNTALTGSGAINVTSGKNLTVSNSLTLAGTDSTVMTFPATSATIARIDAANTFTGVSTISSWVMNGPTPVACGSTCTLGAANVGTYTRLDTAAGSAATLPAASGTGTTYRLYVSVANSSNQDKILLTTVTDTIIGTAIGQTSGTAKVFVGNAGTYHSIQMPFAGTQPSGGFIGDTITCTDVASTIWKCDVVYQAGTTPTTPYSTGTT